MDRSTSAEVFARIRSLAAVSLKDHVLTHRWQVGGATSYRIGHADGSSIHEVIFVFDRDVICVWGDSGEAVIRAYGNRSLDWIMGSSSEEYPDYTLSKVRASGDPRTEFRVGDAVAYLDDQITEYKNDGCPALASEMEDLRDALLAEDDDPETTFRAGLREMDHDDPMRCHGPSSEMLWIWFALKTFVRLFKPQYDEVSKALAESSTTNPPAGSVG